MRPSQLRVAGGLCALVTGAGLLVACGSVAVPGPHSSGHDALTVLASVAIGVNVVRIEGAGDAVVTQTLQTDYNSLGFDAPDSDLGYFHNHEDLPVFGGAVGTGYVVFWSYNRGGQCVSAVFSFAGEDQPLRLLVKDTNFGPDAPRGFRLGNRFVTMPRTVSYQQLVSSLYPNGGPVYVSNSGESWCPGP
ncbi:MAG: hypothetical protein ACRDYC_11155 [Acidimicrobiales bacterium]